MFNRHFVFNYDIFDEVKAPLPSKSDPVGEPHLENKYLFGGDFEHVKWNLITQTFISSNYESPSPAAYGQRKNHSDVTAWRHVTTDGVRDVTTNTRH